jgi:uncharacterized membrane protein
MVKQSQQNRLAKNNKNELMVEQNLTIDDSLIPTASELEKLKEIDPNIITWILSRAEIEQNARLDFNKESLNINRDNVKKVHRFNFTALIFGFVLFILILSVSTFFVIKGMEVEGTIFGGSAILAGVIFFIKAANQNHKNRDH